MRRHMLLRKTLRDVRTATVAIAVALFTMALLDTFLYPEYRTQFASFEMPEMFRGMLGEAGDWTSPAGFFTAEFFSWIPLLLITLAIIGATGTLAGEESDGTLDLLLAQPIQRTRLVLEKAAGLCIAVGLATIASIPGFFLGVMLVDIDLGFGKLVLAVLNMLPVTLLFLTLTLWASTALPSRGAAAVAGIAAVVVTYFLNMLGASVDSLATVRALSPFYWSDASRVLLHGIDPVRSGGLLALAGLFLALAVWHFERRDIAVGARDWRSVARTLLRRRPHARPPSTVDQRAVPRPRGGQQAR